MNVETAAYYIALALVVTVPPGLLVWFIVHPFVHTWRRLGITATYAIVSSVLLLVGAAIYLVREPLLRVHFGVHLPLAALAGVSLLMSCRIAVRRVRQLPARVMLGLPEISPAQASSRLVTEGIYAEVRNPRYLEAGFGLLAGALFTGYLAVYVLVAAYVPLIYLVVLLEEKELRARFGDAFDAYSREVPRFVPTFGRRQTRSRGHDTGRPRREGEDP